jgi:AraC-like DNA-binding protein
MQLARSLTAEINDRSLLGEERVTMGISRVRAPSEIRVLTGSEILPRHPAFCTHDLDRCREYNGGVFREHNMAYLPGERHLDFHHRQAKLGSLGVNLMVMEYGAGVMIDAPPFTNFYLLQFTLSGWCEIWQNKAHKVLPTGSVTIVNPFSAFKKAWMPGARQLLVQIDKQLVEREFRAWTGVDDAGEIQFELSPIDDLAKVGTLWRYVRMLCNDLKEEKSDLVHPLVSDRLATGLVSILLASMPHNRTRAVEAPARSIAPFFVRRAEQFIEEHAREAIALADLSGVAGVSTRALQMGFRQFRNTTPMAHLRAIRLELARTELLRAGRKGGAVTAVAMLLGFGNLGRFARDYQARFGELPSETLLRGSIERA